MSKFRKFVQLNKEFELDFFSLRPIQLLCEHVQVLHQHQQFFLHLFQSQRKQAL